MCSSDLATFFEHVDREAHEGRDAYLYALRGDLDAYLAEAGGRYERPVVCADYDAPIDVFDVTLRATWGWYFDGGLGFLPYQGVTGTLDLQRDARKDEGFASTALTLGADPTLKLKLWRIIGLDAWSFSNFRVTPVPGLDAPYVYEPLTDVVIAWNDTLVEQQAVLLFEGIDGVDRPLLLVGATEKNRWTLVSKDRSMLVGAIAVARPGTKPVVPTIAAMVLWYVDDFDREGPIPTLQGQVSWEIDRPFR